MFDFRVTRKDARIKGLKFYFTGKPCSRGHIRERYVNSGGCFQCRYENAIKWTKSNYKKHLSNMKKWRERYPERKRLSNESWRKEKGSKYCSKLTMDWQRNNKEKHNMKIAKRRAAKIQRIVPWSDNIKIQKLYCKAQELTKKTGIVHHVDHIIPLQGKNVSGLHTHDNLQILTASENCSKGNNY